MLVKWMLALGLQGTAFVTIVPAGFDGQNGKQSPTPALMQTSGQPKERVSANWSLLDSGFQSMYELDFAGALQRFTQYQRENPGDPMGPVAEAAGLLFSEFSRIGVLESQMFLKDATFTGRSKVVLNSSVLRKFDGAINSSKALARKRLAHKGSDRDALLASAFAAGLQAECLALVQNRSMAALQYVRCATGYAQRLVSVCPDCYDAYVTTGVGGYLIGSGTTPAGWILRASGFSGNECAGIKEFRIVAARCYYLLPFAEILLTLAFLRDRDPQQAGMLMGEPGAGFSRDTMFFREWEPLSGGEERRASLIVG